MNTDDFEQRLREQAPRSIPDEWRSEILRAASAARVRGSDRAAEPVGWRACVARQYGRLSRLLWPSPKAWAALAAAWVFILAVQLSVHGGGRGPATVSAVPSLQMQRTLKEQRQLLTELMGEPEGHPARPSKGAAMHPRSERRSERPMA